MIRSVFHDYLSRRLQPARTRENDRRAREIVTLRGLSLAAQVGTKASSLVNRSLSPTRPPTRSSRPSGAASPRFRRLGLWLLILILVGLNALAIAQQPQPPRLKRGVNRTLIRRSNQANRARTSMLLEASAPILNLFSRAREGIERRDWKFTIDCLQRVIDDPEDSLVSRTNGASEEGTLYESVRRRAVHMLASLPPEGLRAYRLMYDGKAKGLYERAKIAHDPIMLRTVVDRYPLTRYGDDAADLLASWALDEGRPGEALALLTDLVEMVPDRDVPEALIAGKMAAASALLGRVEQAPAAVIAFRDSPDRDSVPDWFRTLEPQDRQEDAARGNERAASDQPVVPALPFSDRLADIPGRSGRMPPIDPTFVDPAPWRFELPGDFVPWPRREPELDPAETLELPTAYLVRSGPQLFVRFPTGVAALDIDDLTMLWRHPPVEERAHAYNRADPRSSKPARSTPNAGGRSQDEVAAELSVSHGLVFSVEDGEPTPGAPPLVPSPRRGSPPRVEGRANRLVARNVETGAIRWQRGRTGDPDDPLLGVSFRAAPLAVGDAVWVPFVQRSDLFLAVLDPRDGSLIHRIALGSLPNPSGAGLVKTPALPPAAANGMVYVPTDNGVLFAVDSTNYALRWANQYRSPPQPSNAEVLAPQLFRGRSGALAAEEETGSWLPSRPVISGGLVLLAPTDHGNLLAFSATGGEYRWSAPGGDYAYIIAAVADRVWLGGRAVACLSLSDGEELWTTEECKGEVDESMVPCQGDLCPTPCFTGTPTGRAILSGSVIHVPTAKGLWSLDSLTGAPTDRKPLPESQTPLGNLLCTATAMFSVEPTSVRKFPDMERTFASARAELETECENDLCTPHGEASAVLRLAWMHLLSDDPRSAYELIDSLEAGRREGSEDFLRLTPEAQRPRRERAVARMKVESLLAMARNAMQPNGECKAEPRLARCPTPDQAMGFLQEALASARTPEDRIRCTLAIADQSRAMGQPDQAYETLLAVGLSASADKFVSLTERIRGTARFDIARRLRVAESELTDAQRQRLTKSLWARIEGAADALHRAGDEDTLASDSALRPRQARARLDVVADLLSTGAAGAQAVLALAEWDLKHLRYEPAEQLLRTAIRWDADPATTLTAQMRLCATYSEPSYRDAGLLVPCLDRLLRRFSADDVLEQVLETVPRPEPLGNGRFNTLGEWTDALRTTAGEDEDEAATVAALAPGLQCEPGGASAWSVYLAKSGQNAKSLPFTPSDELQQRLDRAAGIASPRLVHFDRGDNAVLRRRAIFHVAGDLIYCQRPDTGELLWHTTLQSPDDFSDRINVQLWRSAKEPRRAVYDGQTAVFNGLDGLYAVGLVTGRRLWMRPYEFASESGRPFERDWLMAADNGFLAAMPRAGRLTLMRMRDGATLWERDLRGERIAQIDMRGNRIITQDPYRQRIHLFDATDGRLVRRVLLRQPDIRSGLVDLVLTAGVLCGPDVVGNSERILAVDLETGANLWTLELDKPLIQLFEPREGFVGVGLLGGDLRIIEAVTGEVLLERRVPSVHAVVDAGMHEGTLIIQAVNIRRDKLHPELIGMDIATDTELWRRKDLTALGWQETPFDVIEGVVPSIVEHKNTESPQVRRLDLVMIDARTGKNRGNVANLTKHRSQAPLRLDFDIRPDAAIVDTGLGIKAFRLEREMDDSEKRF